KEEDDQVYAGLSAETEYYSGVNFSVKQGSDQVYVTLADHGLRTGDLVTTSYSGPDVGGIADTDLSVTDSAITVLNSSTFAYTAADTATGNGSAALDFG